MPRLTPRLYFAGAVMVTGVIFTAAAVALNLPGAAAAILLGQATIAAVTVIIGPRASSESTTTTS